MNHQTLLALVSAAWVASELVVAIVTRRGGTQKTPHDRGSFALIWFVLFAGIYGAAQIRFMRFGRMPDRNILFWAGLALIAIGIIVRATAIYTLRRFFTVQVTIHDSHELIDHGLYAKVRHPSYTGSLISFIGLGFAFGNWLSLALILAAASIGLGYRIHVEEAALMNHFGDRYRTYASRTKRLIPGIYCLAALMLFAAPAHAAEILVLGTFHMANPGHDINNVHVDDVLAPKRQAEIAEVIAVLKKFQPTKVAVEVNPGSSRMASQYADYLAGKFELPANEIHQIGYRLAKELGQKTIYGVDADGDYPWMPLLDYAKAHDRSKELDSVTNEWAERAKQQEAFLASHTILETLMTVNSDEYARAELATYYRIPRFGEPNDFAGAELLADWYRRNIRIYSNILQLIDSPNERILVVFGSGHLAWLRQDIANNPDLRLRKLADFVK